MLEDYEVGNRLRDQVNQFLHFTVLETEAQRGEMTHPMRQMLACATQIPRQD